MPTLTIDGSAKPVFYRVIALYGERLDSVSQDHLLLQIFDATTVDTHTVPPMYIVNADVLRGNIHIKA